MLAQALDGVAVLPPVAGGTMRQASVLAGLEALAALPEGERPDLVLVHDGARPYVTAKLVQNVIAALAEHPGAIPAVPVADTLKREEGASLPGQCRVIICSGRRHRRGSASGCFWICIARLVLRRPRMMQSCWKTQVSAWRWCPVMKIISSSLMRRTSCALND